MTRDTGRLRRGPPSLLDTLHVLEAAADGGKGRWLLRGGVKRSLRSDARRSALPHHIQCGGGCGGEVLGDGDGGGRGRAGQVWTRG